MSPEFRKWLLHYADYVDSIADRKEKVERDADAAAVDALLADMTKRFKAAGWPKRGTE